MFIKYIAKVINQELSKMTSLLTWSVILLHAVNAFTFQPNPTQQRVAFNIQVNTHTSAVHACTPVCRTRSTGLFSASIDDEVITRREWATKSFVSASTLALISAPKTAGATTATLAPKTVVPSSVCDPSVSTFRNPTNNRIVHILGTAHISSASAEVAGQLVRDIKPSAVFVELDAKRVGRAIPKPTNDNSNEIESGKNDSLPPQEKGSITNAAAAVAAPAPGLSDAVQTMSQQDVSPQVAGAPKAKNPFNFKEKLLNSASQMVGNSIKGLYSKLESEGFSAGEEFVVAVKEGLNVGSKIILGDQDVEVTLRRLTEALSKTDMKKLLAADSEIEQKMKQFMPDNGTSLEGPGSGEMSKEEFKYFVETIKAKENVKMLMANLKSVAPEVYQAMVGERDLYMANGLDRLNQFDSIVAVMGIAHVDGVEGVLKERGWEEVRYSSCN